MTKRLQKHVRNLRFATVLDVGHSLFALMVARRRQKFAFHHSFGILTFTSCRQTYPAKKKKKKRSRIFEEQPSSAAFLSSFSQQPFKAAFLSSLPQQPFLSQQLSQVSSAAFLSCHPQPSSCRGQGMKLWSGVGGQLLTSSCCGQGLVVSY